VPREGVYRLEGDVGSLAVPDSLRGLLAARLDALDPELHNLVADAAVLGSTFPAEALVAVSGRPDAEVRLALAELVRREVLEVSSDPLSPQRGSYGFTHNLLRQVAYEMLSRRDRKTRHLAVAAHLRATFAGDGDEMIDVIARHYLDALAAVPGDPDTDTVRTEAISALERAAERALRSGAPLTASNNFAAAATLTAEADAPESALAAAALLERAAAADSITGNAALSTEHADAARAIYDRLGEKRAAARVQVIAGQALREGRRYSEARDRLQAALTVLRENPDRDTVTALSELSSIEAFTGGPAADALTTEALVLGQAVDVDAHRLATLFIVRGIAMYFANRNSEALANIEFAARLAEQAGDSIVLGRALVNLSTGQLPTDPAAAAAAAKTATELCRRVGARGQLATAVANLATAQLWMGEWDQTEELVQTAAEADGLAETTDVTELRILLAALRGDLRTASELHRRAHFSTAEDLQDRSYSVALELLMASVADDPLQVVRRASEVVEIAEGLGIRHEVVTWAWPLVSRAAQSVGDTATLNEMVAALDAHPNGHLPPLLRIERDLANAPSRVDPAATFGSAIMALRRFGSPYHLAHGLLDYAGYLVSTGDTVGADPLIEEALGIADRLRARPLRRRAELVESRRTPSSETGGRS
jgi:hypothetical protein